MKTDEGLAATAPADPLRERVLCLAESRHGVVWRRQLLEAGVPESRVDNWLRSGWLKRVHPGVFHCRDLPFTAWSAAMAAALSAANGDAWGESTGGISLAVSHRPAAVLLGYLPDGGRDAAIDVSGTSVRRTRGVRGHRTRVGPGDAFLLHGVPVTSGARTVLDLAAVVTARELEQALAAALRSSRDVRPRLDQLLQARANQSGSGAVRRLLRHLDSTGTAPMYLRSPAEEAFLSVIRRARLPVPASNQQLLGFEVDFLWQDARLVAEVDGRRYHEAWDAFHRDRDRDLTLALGGYRTLRFTWRQINDDALATVASVATALTEGRR